MPTDIAPDSMFVAETRITRVNARECTVSLVSDGPNTVSALDVPWPVPYRHPDGGGIDYVPEVGATCMALWHPWDSLPVILGFSSSFHPNLVWASGRRELNPGDVIVWARDDNRIVVRRGGNIEIISTPECKRIYVFARHAIEEMCREWHMTTRGGEILWETDASSLGAKTGSASVLSIKAKRFAQDAEHFISIRAGELESKSTQVGTPNSHVFDIRIGGTPLTPLYRLSVDSAGGVESEVRGNEYRRGYGNYTHETTGLYTVRADTGVVVESKSGNISVSARAGIHSVAARSSAEDISTEKSIRAPQVNIGMTPTSPAVLGDALVAWLSSHTHAAPGTPPVQVPALTAILSKNLKIQ